MKFKVLLISCLTLFNLSSFAQNFSFYQTDSVEVKNGTNPYTLAWAGGLNNAQYGNIDLNLDGTLDLIVFDKDGARVLPFLHAGTASSYDYIYAPEYAKQLPEYRSWGLYTDFNGDGKMDLFAHTSGGIKAYKNISSSTNLLFQDVTDGPYLKTDFGSGPLNLYVSSEDIPAIEDYDGDGDLDVVTFGVSGTRMELHRNVSMENYGNLDSLHFVMETLCFGDMEENLSNNNVTLDVCSVPSNPCRIGYEPGNETLTDSPEQGAHAGSTMLLFDMDADGDKELVLGDISFNNLILARNGGCAAFADMDSVYTNYPEQSPVNIPIYPAAFHLDLDNDGIEDLAVAPNATNVSLTNNCNWSYKNIGTQNAPIWQYTGADFLEGEMIELGSRAIPTFADLSGDGLPDLIVGNYGYYITSGNYSSQLAYFINVGTSSEAKFELATDDLGGLSGISGLGVSQHPSFADLDADGDLDMITGDADGKFHYFTNIGDATHPAFSLTSAQMGGIDIGDFAAPFLIDIDTNGIIDLVLGERDGTLNFLENAGTANNPIFNTVTKTNYGEVSVARSSILGHSVPYFFEHNGELQLFVGSYSGEIFHYNQITGSINLGFALVDSLSADVNHSGYSTPAVANLLANTTPDLIIGNRSGGLELYRGSAAPVGLNEVTNSFEINAFPNPTTGILTIQVENVLGGLTYELFSMDGRLVKTGTLLKTQSELNIEMLDAGLYLIRVFGEDSSANSQVKILKQ